MKKIKQWFIGLLISIYGASVILCFVGTTMYFIGMMNSTGLEFIGHFIGFVVLLTLSIFMPYVCFKQMQDGVKEEFK